ncbi:MAG: ATP-binding protein, partial [Bacteroidota bacterium]
DYSLEGRGIEIRIFDDRLEVLSPGKLLSKLTIEDLKELKGAHETRNTYLARVLREYGYIRELGEGIRRMFDLMNKNELVPPRIESPNKSFIVTLFYKFIYTKEEKIWLDHFENFDFNREHKTILKLGINGRLISPKEIFDHVGIVDTDYYRQLLEDLRKNGVLVSKVSNTEAQKLSKKKRVSKKSIPRFQIVLPAKNAAEEVLQNINQTTEVDDNADYAKVFVAGVDWYATEADVEEVLSQFGSIADIVIPINKETNKSKGYAFVEFEKIESAKKALGFRGRLALKGRRLYINKVKD